MKMCGGAFLKSPQLLSISTSHIAADENLQKSFSIVPPQSRFPPITSDTPESTFTP